MLDEFLASVVKESVGGAYAAESEGKAERDSFFGVVGWHDVLRRY